jgi:SAM-dependent methyltransferase
MNLRRRRYEHLYNQVGDESRLCWQREEIPLLLNKALESVDRGSKALDIGCGTGVLAVFMAQKGLNVTALDYVAGALDFAKRRSDQSGVEIDLVNADVLKWKTSEKYRLILDSCCLHNMRWINRFRYKKQILKWMDDESIYILIHAGKTHFFNFRVGGPIRKNPSDIERFFSPELKLRDLYTERKTNGLLFHYRFELK